MAEQRQMRILGAGEGVVAVPVPGEADRSRVGSYWSAVRRFLNTGDLSSVAEFEGSEIGGVALETDPDAIEEWWRKGELDFPDIYE